MIQRPLLVPMTVAELASNVSRAHAALEKTDPKMQQLVDALASLGAKPVDPPTHQ